MSAIVLLIRHGQPSVPSGVLYGGTDVPLSPEGIREGRALAPVLGSLALHRVVSSPLARARETAEAAGVETETVFDLREIHLGTWEMRTSQELMDREPRAFRDRWNHLETFRPPGGESFQDLADRAIPALRPMVPSSGGILAVFGHLGVFRAVLWKELNIPLKTTFSVAQAPCGIHVLEYGASGPRLLRANWRPSVV